MDSPGGVDAECLRVSRRYSNPDPAHAPHGMRAIVRWGITDRLLGRRRVSAPGTPAPRVEPDLGAVRAVDGPARLTWIGHSSFLGSAAGAAFVIDPMFSPRAGWLVPRHVAAGLEAHQLPKLDALLVTHSHYDHLDDRSVRALPREVPVIVPRSTGTISTGNGVLPEVTRMLMSIAGPPDLTLA